MSNFLSSFLSGWGRGLKRDIPVQVLTVVLGGAVVLAALDQPGKQRLAQQLSEATAGLFPAQMPRPLLELEHWAKSRLYEAGVITKPPRPLLLAASSPSPSTVAGAVAQVPAPATLALPAQRPEAKPSTGTAAPPSAASPDATLEAANAFRRDWMANARRQKASLTAVADGLQSMCVRKGGRQAECQRVRQHLVELDDIVMIYPRAIQPQDLARGDLILVAPGWVGGLVVRPPDSPAGPPGVMRMKGDPREQTKDVGVRTQR